MDYISTDFALIAKVVFLLQHGQTDKQTDSQMQLITSPPHTQPFYGSLDFVRDNLGEPVPEETFTHSHLLWSSVVPYLLRPSSMIHHPTYIMGNN